MLRIKKLDLFVLKSFLLLFAGTFFICLFIFMMQFLWRYVDELVGKGLSMEVMAQFFFYSALTLVPASLPLAVLLASLITFGDFGERFELLAMKAAGVSLLRIMRPLIVFILFVCGISFFFQNIIGPKAEVKLWTLLISMKQKSPELDIPEGVFYDEIQGYNLYVKHKNRDTGMLYNVMIYDLKEGFENAHIIVADSGLLEMTADKKHLYLHLYSGEQFENLRSQDALSESVPYRRESFSEKHTIIEFDSDFNMVDGGFIKDNSRSKDLSMLQASIDSMEVVTDSVGRAYYKEAMNSVYRKTSFPLSKEDSIKAQQKAASGYNVDSLLHAMSLLEQQKVLTMAAGRAQNVTSDWQFKQATVGDNNYNIRRHKADWHKKFTISLSCLFFFFIGAPLGGIIRKGGLGMPVVVSVLFFIVYYIIDTTGYKMARDGYWVVWSGMWLSSVVLAPIGFFLTYKSNNDSVVFNVDLYIEWLKRVAGIRSVRHLFKKEVIIDDPDYPRLDKDLSALSEECNDYLGRRYILSAPNYFRLWTTAGQDAVMEQIIERLELYIEELSNTKSVEILNLLNTYPVIPAHAHTRPFHQYWLNILAGLILPIGLVYYFRIWRFRLRLKKDLERIVKTNEEIRTRIKTL